MCSIDAYYKLNSMFYDYFCIGGGRPLTYGETTGALKSLCKTINFIKIWLQMFKTKYMLRCNSYREKMNELFKKSPKTFPLNKFDKSKKNYVY